MKDGDHPDTIVVTYARCRAATELVAQVCERTPPRDWHGWAARMLDRDLLADDEWWAGLAWLRKDNCGANGQLPSYATRVTAGHLLAVAADAWKAGADSR